MADTQNFDSILREIHALCERSEMAAGRLADIGDNLGGGVPRGVSDSKEAPAMPGLIGQMMQGLRRLRDSQETIHGEISRIDNFTGRNKAPIATPNTYRGAIQGQGFVGAAAQVTGY